MKIICYGDSNTYGYDAASFFGDRLPSEERWVDIMASELQCKALNYGENGHMIPRFEYDFYNINSIIENHKDLDYIIIMLGSNDLCMTSRPNMDNICSRMESFLDYVMEAFAPEKIILIAPTPVHVDFPDQQIYDSESEKFGEAYKKAAMDRGIIFADAGKWNIHLSHDGIHFSPKGHKKFARKLSELIRSLSPSP